MVVYIDESGDTGWKFSKPNQHGGSSRYLSIAHVICPEADKGKLTRVVRKVYRKFKLKLDIEKKGSSFSSSDAARIAERIVDLLREHPDIRIGVITVKKENVFEAIREDQNIIYNYALVMSLAPMIQSLDHVRVIPDKRTVKILDGDTLDNYLRMKLHAEMESGVRIFYEPRISENEKNLWFIDWVANFIWRHYEQGDSSAFRLLENHIKIKQLYFKEESSAKTQTS